LKPLYTNVHGDNSDLFKAVSELYLKEGHYIADVTYGKGVFWKQIDIAKYHFYPSDLLTVKKALYDFKFLPYKDNTFDVVVFDPPYCHNPGKMMSNKNYLNAETTKGLYHQDIMELYEKGLMEAKRILKTNGIILVKCKDEIESSIQQWSHIEIQNIATKIGLYAKDLFILNPKAYPVIQYKRQQHARKNHSYLWIFKKYGTSKLPWIIIPIGLSEQDIISWINKQNQYVVIYPKIYNNLLSNLNLNMSEEDSLIWSYILVDVRKNLMELKNVILYSTKLINADFRRQILNKLPPCQKKVILFPLNPILIEQEPIESRQKLYNLEADYLYTRDIIKTEGFKKIEILTQNWP